MWPLRAGFGKGVCALRFREAGGGLWRQQLLEVRTTGLICCESTRFHVVSLTLPSARAQAQGPSVGVGGCIVARRSGDRPAVGVDGLLLSPGMFCAHVPCTANPGCIRASLHWVPEEHSKCLLQCVPMDSSRVFLIFFSLRLCQVQASHLPTWLKWSGLEP